MQKKKIMVLIIGLMIIALGITLFLQAGWGADPFTVMNKGISQFLRMSFGTLQVIINLVLIIMIFKLDRSKLQIGTLLNMLLIGPAVDGFEIIAIRLGIQANTIGQQALLMLIGCIVLSIGVGMAFASDQGMGPYDIVSIMIAERKKYSFKWTRVGTDIVCVTLGGVLGATVGLGTVVAALCMGPLISFFRSLCLKYILQE